MHFIILVVLLIRIAQKRILLVRHRHKRSSEAGSASQSCSFFAALPHADVYAHRSSIMGPDAVVLLLECLCEDCIQIYQMHMLLDPMCRWYQDQQSHVVEDVCWTSELYGIIDDGAVPQPSFSWLMSCAPPPTTTTTALRLLNFSSSPRERQERDIATQDEYLGPLLWTRVPICPLPADLMIKRPTWKTRASATEMPVELHDVVLKFLSLGLCDGPGSPGFRDHQCKDRAECSRNFVDCTRRDLYQMLCVCRRWAHLLQPVMFRRIILRDREDFIQLVTIKDDVLSGGLGRSLEGELDVIENLRTPWIHNISLRLLPKFSVAAKDITLALRNTGPFPPKPEVVCSVHGSLPRRLPSFSSGIRKIAFSGVHFKTFEHLLRLVKEMPSLRELTCTRVTWDRLNTRIDQTPSSTCFLARDDASEAVTYSTQQCTDDRAMHWFHILLGRTRDDILSQDDADTLQTILHAWKDIDGRSYRDADAIVIGPMTTVLTPRAGIRQRRRVRCIVFDMHGRRWPEISGLNWSEVYKQLDTLNALQFVVLMFDSRSALLCFAYIILPFMSSPGLPPRLKLVYAGRTGLVSVSLTNDGIAGEEIGTSEPWTLYCRAHQSVQSTLCIQTAIGSEFYGNVRISGALRRPP
ncbi:hypothetical protein NM688_g3210 [Phlebia brevispora]|uniref:Uncharacterized protein n=1 Tax=Phlebia brevispora TaxID=194682 RepID=A0ACC1T6A4_9APHY|nr:hypothetical protein NM688_g3210 [Phlebia brevispora]